MNSASQSSRSGWTDVSVSLTPTPSSGMERNWISRALKGVIFIWTYRTVRAVSCEAFRVELPMCIKRLRTKQARCEKRTKATVNDRNEPCCRSEL